jgi:hypothetical protein
MIQMGESEKSTIETGTVVAITQRYRFQVIFFLGYVSDGVIMI